MESRFFEETGNGVRCTICPHLCVIQEGKRGVCMTKENQGGKIISLTYGQLSSLAIDPIEKKPLAHFYPGSIALSISSIGCNFICPWCQNSGLSTSLIDDVNTRFMHPEEVVEIAMAQECTSIAYTYNEPLINLNYVEDTAKFARDSDIKNVLVTNGFAHLPSFKKVVDVIDAANVDWKGWNEDFYKKHCGGHLQDVIDATQLMHDSGVHVEVTFLIIPQTNDGEDEIRGMSEHINENLCPDTPLHLSRFHPSHKFQHIPPTPVETLLRAREIAQESGLRYVFVGNVRGEGYEDTVCPGCGEHVVKRSGYDITEWALDESNRCAKCGEPIPIIGGREEHGP
jgi:pyruvate formate lyase activating enzyme